MTIVMAYDFGTTSLKAALVAHGGGIIADANVAYPVEHPHTDWAEQDPDLLWQRAGEAGRAALSRARIDGSDITSVVFVAPWKGIIPISAAGETLAPAMIWMDSRARAQAERMNARADRFLGTGQEYWPRLLWLKEERPALWSAARWLLGMNSYVKWRATGLIATEPSDSFISVPDDEEIARAVEVAGLTEDVEKFAPEYAATDVVGALTREAAADLGLPAGIPVLGGFGDIPAITVGTGPLVAGAAHIYFGTSSWLLSVLAAGEDIDAPLTVRLDRERRAAVFPLQTGCLAYDWIVEQLFGAEKAHLDDGIQNFVNAQVDDVPAGSESLLATPWLTGELPPLSKNARGTFINLSTRHDRRHMVRAVMESICYAHRTSLERLEEQTGSRLSEIVVVGGGATSAVWMQMLADVLDRTVVVPENPRSIGVIGAHYCSVVAAGEAAGLDAIRPPRRHDLRFTPRRENRAVYDRLFALHARIFPALSSIFDELNSPTDHKGI